MVHLTMRLINEGASAAKINAPSTLKEFMELDEKRRNKILFFIPFYIVLSTDGKSL